MPPPGRMPAIGPAFELTLEVAFWKQKRCLCTTFPLLYICTYISNHSIKIRTHLGTCAVRIPHPGTILYIHTYVNVQTDARMRRGATAKPQDRLALENCCFHRHRRQNDCVNKEEAKKIMRSQRLGPTYCCPPAGAGRQGRSERGRGTDYNGTRDERDCANPRVPLGKVDTVHRFSLTPRTVTRGSPLGILS